MPCILVTRPQAASQSTAATLQNLGYQTVIEPLLSIAPLRGPNPAAGGDITGVMITSANALAALDGRQKEIASLLERPCFCVGDRTAEKARGFGFLKVQSADSDGAGLAKLIFASIGDTRASLLHIAGRDVDAAAQQELEKRGYRVAVWPVYEAAPVAALTGSARRMLEEGAIDAVLLYSKRTAEVLTALFEKPLLEACCARLAAICLSESVAETLRPLGWRHLAIAAQPTEDAMIACLQKNYPAKK